MSFDIDPSVYFLTDANFQFDRNIDDLQFEILMEGGSLGSWIKNNARAISASPYAKALKNYYLTYGAPAVRNMARYYLGNEVTEKAEKFGKDFIASDDKVRFIAEKTKKPAQAMAGDLLAQHLNEFIKSYGNQYPK